MSDAPELSVFQPEDVMLGAGTGETGKSYVCPAEQRGGSVELLASHAQLQHGIRVRHAETEPNLTTLLQYCGISQQHLLFQTGARVLISVAVR